MHKELLGLLVGAVGVFAALSLQAEEMPQVNFVLEAVPTDLAECMAALEAGTSLTFTHEELDKFGGLDGLVVYEGHFFGFHLASHKGTSHCIKASPKGAPEALPQEGRDLLPPAPAD
jgi:hypothetical protein